jgi:uncharacterized membrane-anchored protein YhcB (DUF1043 family)
MSEQFWTILIQFVIGPIAVLVVGWFLNREIKKTKQEITNSHPQHLRDDLDAKFALVFAKLDTSANLVATVDEKLDDHIETYKRDSSTVFGTLADHENRLTGQAGKLRRVSKK